MQKLTVSIADYPEVPNGQIAYFVGDFDGYAKESIAELEKAVAESAPNTILIFEFSGLNYLNSFAIGQLVSWHNTLSEKGGKIVIVGTNKNVEDIFSVLGIHNILSTYSNLEEAKKELA